MSDETRPALEAEWLHLTRVELPALAATRHWPVRADHCFQRILLDNACGGCWYDYIVRRPAYAHAPADMLAHAVATGRAAIAGQADMDDLNRRPPQPPPFPRANLAHSAVRTAPRPLSDTIRHCERSEATQGSARNTGLLRCARNDGSQSRPATEAPHRSPPA